MRPSPPTRTEPRGALRTRYEPWSFGERGSYVLRDCVSKAVLVGMSLVLVSLHTSLGTATLTEWALWNGLAVIILICTCALGVWPRCHAMTLRNSGIVLPGSRLFGNLIPLKGAVGTASSTSRRVAKLCSCLRKPCESASGERSERAHAGGLATIRRAIHATPPQVVRGAFGGDCCSDGGGFGESRRSLGCDQWLRHREEFHGHRSYLVGGHCHCAAGHRGSNLPRCAGTSSALAFVVAWASVVLVSATDAQLLDSNFISSVTWNSTDISVTNGVNVAGITNEVSYSTANVTEVCKVILVGTGSVDFVGYRKPLDHPGLFGWAGYKAARDSWGSTNQVQGAITVSSNLYSYGTNFVQGRPGFGTALVYKAEITNGVLELGAATVGSSDPDYFVFNIPASLQAVGMPATINLRPQDVAPKTVYLLRLFLAGAVLFAVAAYAFQDTFRAVESAMASQQAVGAGFSFLGIEVKAAHAAAAAVLITGIILALMVTASLILAAMLGGAMSLATSSISDAITGTGAPGAGTVPWEATLFTTVYHAFYFLDQVLPVQACLASVILLCGYSYALMVVEWVARMAIRHVTP